MRRLAVWLGFLRSLPSDDSMGEAIKRPPIRSNVAQKFFMRLDSLDLWS
ncbi:hypothetical protein CCC_01610 [Paramagnetospirillum magnetotacticum MS-1]|uniref:Uncharacterized protein n=1 Tax=Paramagnetospirillum magnetotacticum MS-1 TaxID=272627 RepID=A0A0C2YAH6_PARME|nr:hypothetical protein CCC_01610 [Paramagnetospirillum magnetotacticum MS-1]